MPTLLPLEFAIVTSSGVTSDDRVGIIYDFSSFYDNPLVLLCCRWRCTATLPSVTLSTWPSGARSVWHTFRSRPVWRLPLCSPAPDISSTQWSWTTTGCPLWRRGPTKLTPHISSSTRKCFILFSFTPCRLHFWGSWPYPCAWPSQRGRRNVAKWPAPRGTSNR